MLNSWQSHQEYKALMHEAKIHFDSSQRIRLCTELATVREKVPQLPFRGSLYGSQPVSAPLFRPGDANWGWDSDLDGYFFGYTLYPLVCHSPDAQVNLPLSFRFIVFFYPIIIKQNDA